MPFWDALLNPSKYQKARDDKREDREDRIELRQDGRNYRTDSRQDGRNYRVGPGGSVKIHDGWSNAAEVGIPAVAGAVASGVTGGVGSIGADLAAAWDKNGAAGVLAELQGGDGAVSNETNYLPWLGLAALAFYAVTRK